MMEEEKRKKILFMITSLYGGGAERVCCLLASAMAKQHDVTIVYFTEKEDRYPLDPRVRCVVIPKQALKGIPCKTFFRGIGMIRFIRRLKRDMEADVAVSMLLSMNLLNALSKGKERVICSERANPRKYKPHLFPLTRFAYRRADHVVFQTEQVRSLYGRKIRGHSTVIQNPVSLAIRANDNRVHRIVNMGRLAEQKNQAMLIRAFASFVKGYPDYTLSIYGEGELLEKLQVLAESLDVSDSVIFEGNQKHVHDLIRDAEIFVLSSNYEGLSNAMLECMTMGIACISTRCEGAAEVIRDGENGLLVPIGGERELTEALKRLAGDAQLRHLLERQAMEDAKAFDVNDVIGKWENVFFES